MGRNLHVDRLRGAASLGVILSHAGGYGVLGALLYLIPRPIVVSIMANAYHAVTLFFVISGFLITNKILNASEGEGGFSLGRFYLDRVARIAPCLVAAVGAALGLALAGFAAFQVDWSCVPSALLAIFTFHFNVWDFHFNTWTRLWPSANAPLPRVWDPLWSLSIEEVFYLGFPALMLLLSRRSLTTVLIALVVAGPISRAGPGSFFAYLSNFDQLSIGVLTAFLSRRTGAADLPSPVLRLCRWAGFAIVATTFLATQDGLAVMVWGPEAIGLGAALYLFGTATAAKPRSFGVLKVPEFFGRLSYEVYLLHMFFLVALGSTHALASWKANPMLFDMICLPAFLAAVAASAVLISKVYSEPANRWIKSRFVGGKAKASSWRAPVPVAVPVR